MFHTPILFILFNRLETTKQVFAKIREIQPAQLFIAADGARLYKEGEDIICQKVRDWVTSNIDWECNATTRFQTENLGCGLHVSSAITWFFEHVEEGIILEDDCVPDISFFPYCTELLEKYRNNEHIYVIGGNNFQKKKRGSASYYFSAYGHIWGWATWKRAWATYTYTLSDINDTIMQQHITSYFNNTQVQNYWYGIFKKMKYEPIDTWDYQWTFCQWLQNAINIMPNVNLVSNIGFDSKATHTKTIVEGISNVSTKSIMPIIHPEKIKINKKADLYTFYKNFERKKKNMFWHKVRDKLIYEFKKM